MSAGALAGIKVIDFGQMVSAPFCARLFADYGADVVKVELPGGDTARAAGPFPGDVSDPEKSGLYFINNTNKRGITCDVATEAGRALFLRLLAWADLLIENHSPAQMRAWGLDYATLAATNPDLVVVSITPFGQTGPYSEWNGYDLNAYHLTGASHRYCGRPGEMPLEHGTFAADYCGAVAAAAWGLAAVLGRRQAGGGQHLDVSTAETIAATFVGGQNIGGFAQTGNYDTRTGVGMPQGAPATIMPCMDGHVWMLALEPGQWNGLRRVMGNPEWADLDLFQSMFERAQNADLIYPFIEEWTMQHGKMEIMEKCQAAGCPVTAVLTVAEAAEQPHLAARNYFVDIEHAALGRVRTLGAPFRLPESPGGPKTPAPLLGEHNAELGRELAELPDTPIAAPHGATQDPGRALPLQGLRVINFGWVWAGPVAGQTLGFLGAEVLKIESRARIDMTRNLPPFAEGVPGPDRSLSNHACWAGNGSVSLNLKQPEAKRLALELVAKADVVIENFGPGVMEQLGLGYQELRKVKQDLVMLSMPAAGLDGPLREVRTYGLSVTSTTGLDSLVGYKGGGPIPVENAFSDPFVGIFGSFAILTALHHRDASGQGQHIDFSQQEAIMQMVGPAYIDYALNGRVGGPKGNEHPLAGAAPHGVFRCTGDDRWISIAVPGEAEWQGLVRAMDKPAWAASERFATRAARVANIDELHRELAAWILAFDNHELATTLQAHGVAAAPVLCIADLLADPHYRARKTFVEVVHPLGFSETIYGAYVKTSRTVADIRPGPAIGQDNERVFRDILGMPQERYRQLVEDGVIY
ncbi:MAG: CoA transferase [Pseudomonadales bacterium]|nr:CoA transferase [Gammaproteobacteria bacterium]MBP6050307.1 CoA transferase [Pseudomonadales bacterium]MBK6583774.1 CoA transferase [Gammaproteobacteria bacterium]MBK7522111.1 CoA transferase [Gammaproteobacteria bacterium]MBK9664749.1 CoA transferase [Gammaproteobacteria bacterium]